MTSVKHFAAYGAVEGGKEYNTVDMSPSACSVTIRRCTKRGWTRQRRGDGGADSLTARQPPPIPGCEDVLRDQWGSKGSPFPITVQSKS
ncbi:hypothetical protein ACNKHU_13090 [Shigella flexneri]